LVRLRWRSELNFSLNSSVYFNLIQHTFAFRQLQPTIFIFRQLPNPLMSQIPHDDFESQLDAFQHCGFSHIMSSLKLTYLAQYVHLILPSKICKQSQT
jgi:hypothetical protein